MQWRVAKCRQTVRITPNKHGAGAFWIVRRGEIAWSGFTRSAFKKRWS
jgi:hypothetical protein